jgi:putative tricarboxylic transport membrane protein
MKRYVAGIGASLVLILSLFVWFYARTFPTLPDGHPGPGLFPSAVAIGLFLCGCYLAFRSLRVETTGPPEDTASEGRSGGLLRIGAVLAAIGLYPPLSGLLGFVPTVSALGFLVAILLGARPIPGAVTAVAGTGLVYLLFTRVLGVPL